MHNLSKAKQLIKRYEGLRLEAYQDVAGVWTIGYGTTWLINRPVCAQDKCTKDEAESWLYEHMLNTARAIQKVIKVEITENEFNALVSFAYNIGTGAFKNSTLLKLLNDRAPERIVALEFHKWNKAGGKVVNGLVARRADEANLFLQVDFDEAA